jgi:iron complex transport system substrate-binding protein
MAMNLTKVIVYFYFISLCVACRSPQKESAGFFLEITDSYNRTVTLDKEPLRIVSLSPGITEMVFLLQSENKLVAVSDYCNYPSQAKSIPKAGGLIQINIEKLLTFNPDIVLIGSIITKADVEKIEKSGIKIIAIKEENKIEGIYNALSQLGKILNKNELADQKIAELKNQLSAVIVDSSKKPKSVYYVVGFGASGDFTAPSNSHIHDIITLSGGRNVGDQLKSWSVNREYLFKENPDIIFVRKEDFNFFTKTYPYTELKAVKTKHTYPIESGWMDVISPRNILAIQEINSKIIQEN